MHIGSSFLYEDDLSILYQYLVYLRRSSIYSVYIVYIYLYINIWYLYLYLYLYLEGPSLTKYSLKNVCLLIPINPIFKKAKVTAPVLYSYGTLWLPGVWVRPIPTSVAGTWYLGSSRKPSPCTSFERTRLEALVDYCSLNILGHPKRLDPGTAGETVKEILNRRDSSLALFMISQ